MWMVCARGIARDMMDTNNLIEAFHHKLKYTYMRGRPGRRLDGEVYLLVEIVMRDINFSNFLNELKIGRMNPRQRQQRIREIIGNTCINKKDIYKLQPDVWIVHSMTNNDIEYSVRKKDTSKDSLDISSYICTCRDFKTRLLSCKHIFAIVNQIQNEQCEQHNYSLNSTIIESVNYIDQEKIEVDRNVEILKLQEELIAITAEWKDKRGEDIQSLRAALKQTVQMEKARIARLKAIPQVDIIDDKPSQIASNVIFKKQNKF